MRIKEKGITRYPPHLERKLASKVIWRGNKDMTVRHIIHKILWAS